MPGISKYFFLFRKNKTFTHMYFCTSLFAKEKNRDSVVNIRSKFFEIKFRSHRVALCIEEHLKSPDKPVLRPIAVEKKIRSQTSAQFIIPCTVLEFPAVYNQEALRNPFKLFKSLPLWPFGWRCRTL